jgi:hypothetical protein
MVYSSALMFAITFLTLCKGIFGSDGTATQGAKKTLAMGQKTVGKLKEKVSHFCRDECENNPKGGGGFLLNLWL